jgi:hypothetical protein
MLFNWFVQAPFQFSLKPLPAESSRAGLCSARNTKIFLQFIPRSSRNCCIFEQTVGRPTKPFVNLLPVPLRGTIGRIAKQTLIGQLLLIQTLNWNAQSIICTYFLLASDAVDSQWPDPT